MNLRNYQIEISKKGFDILQKYGIVYYSMQVRTGKTLTALNTANLFGAKKVLFVTKKKAISSIISDYNLMKFDYELTVINFESVSKVGTDFDFAIIDEAHSISAFPKPSKRAKDLKAIVYNLPIIFLSGTATPESFSQIYHQFWISYKSPFKEINFYNWARNYVNIKEKYVSYGKINDYSDANIEKINQVTKHLFINFTQEDAGFTSFIDEKILICEMEQSIWDLVKMIKRDKIYRLKNGKDIIFCETSVKEQSKIHQICSGTVILESGETLILSTKKARFIKELFSNQKIAIFYKFQAEKEMLKSVFSNITESIEDFNNSDNLVFIGQFISSREGVNLSTADALIFINIDFASLSYIQSKARIQTKDRTKASKLYWIFSDKGIENLIYKKVIKKQDFTNEHYKKESSTIGVTNTSEINQAIHQTRMFAD